MRNVFRWMKVLYWQLGEHALHPVHKVEGEDWRCNNIFKSTCTAGGKVCRLVIDSKSYDNVVFEEVVHKLEFKMEKQPYPADWRGLGKKKR